MKTKTLKISEIDKKWWIADADSQILGRLASRIAQILKGKHKVNYVPHMDNGDCVVVVNADKIVVTGSDVAAVLATGGKKAKATASRESSSRNFIYKKYDYMG